MIKLREIDHIVLRVVDLDKMVQFYTGVLGCTIEKRQEAIGLIQLRAGSSLVDLVPVDGKLGKMGGAAPGKEGRNVDHFCFRVEDFDEAAILADLKAAGPSIYINDPEGNTVELKGPAWA
jgi:glyoxylase I family protein